MESQTTHSDNPFDDLRSMGTAYLQYATGHPLKYRLMFSSPLPDPEIHVDMMQNSKRAFSLLEERLATMQLRAISDNTVLIEAGAARLDAMFIWSTLHGVASLMLSDVIGTLDMDEQELGRSVERVFQRIRLAIGPEAE